MAASYKQLMFRKVAAAMELHIDLEFKAAIGAGAYESSNIIWGKMMEKYMCDNQIIDLLIYIYRFLNI